jgi:hypothetical protein
VPSPVQPVVEKKRAPEVPKETTLSSIADTKESGGAVIQRALERVRAMKRRLPAGAPETAAVDALWVKLQSEAVLGDQEKAAAHVRALESEIAALEKRVP